MKALFAVILITTISVSNAFAQDSTKVISKKEARQIKKSAPPQKGDIYVIAAPTIGYNPTNGFMYGLGGSASFFLGEPVTTSISSALVNFSLTTKHQLLFTARSTFYAKNNEWILNGDWRYLNSSQPTYGLGTGPSSSKLASNGFEIEDGVFSKPINDAQLMEFTQIRIYETVYKEIKENFYLGLGYHLDVFTDIKDNLLDTTAVPPVITGYYMYNEKYGFSQQKNILSGLSANAIYDTRDNQNNAYKGQYANVTFRVNPEFLGSDKNSSTLWMEYRKFLDLTKNHHNMLCFWGIGNFTTSGNLPVLDLPAIGEDQYGKSGRGYTQGRFRGQEMIYGEVEYRKHLLASKKNPDFFGMVVFVNAVTATNKDADINLFEYVNIGAGAGIRIMISNKSRSSIGIDYGWGNYGSGGLYFRLNEAF